MIEEIITIESFEAFFKRYYAATLRYCNTIVSNDEDAKDIVQQAFMILWQRREELIITVSARAYLYKTIYNGSLDFLKHEKVKQKYLDEKRHGTTITVPRENPSEKEIQARLTAAIEELPEQCRRVFTLSREQKLKYREIAVTLNISEKTVENHMGKALRLIRQSLKKYNLFS